MHNFLVLSLHLLVLGAFILISLRMGAMALHAMLCMIAIAMNIFVLKQIKLFGLDVTATDALAVTYLLGLNLFQEYYGRKIVRQHVFISCMISATFTILGLIHLSYTPNAYDSMQIHYEMTISCLPRIIISSITSFLLIQLIDISFFAYLRGKTGGRWLTLRTTFSLLISQILDTLLFSFLALYGQVGNLWHIILVSIAIKFIVIALCAPITEFSKRLLKPCT